MLPKGFIDAGSLAAASALLLFIPLVAPAAAAEPVTVAIALDTSGSIGKGEFDKARKLSVAVLEQLPPGSDAGLFTFDDQERLLLPWGSSADDVRRGLEIVARTGKFTALHDALYEASRKLQAAPPGRKAVLLITDGKDEGSTLTLEDGLRVAQDGRIPVWVVGMGRVQEKVLKRIAKLTAGEYVPLASATASSLAEKIAAAPPALGMAAPVSSGASAPPAAGPRAASSSNKAPAPPVRSRLRTAGVWIAAGLGIVLCFGIGAFALSRRGRNRCPSCGFELAGPLSSCTYCSAEANARVAEGGRSKAAPEKPQRVGIDTMRRDKPVSPMAAVRVNGTAKGNGHGKHDAAVLSETVLARMSSTEEYLEKTVTLREKPVLVITGGPGSGRVFTLSHEMTTCLGRAKLNDIVLEDISVSSEHCRIRPEEGGFVVHDLKSTNGTYVNAKKVGTQPLTAGDVIQVGETSLLFRMDHQRAS